MKVFTFIAAVLLTSSAYTAALVLLILYMEQPDPLWIGLVSFAIAVLLYSGLLLGSLRAYWDVGTSQQSRAIFRRWTIGLLVTEVVAAVALVAYCVATGASWWIALGGIAAGAVITLVGPWIGGRLRRRDERLRAEGRGSDERELSVRRKVIGIAITFVVALAVGTAALLAVAILTDGGMDAVGTMLVYALGFALLAASFASIIASLGFNRRLRDIASGDLGRVQRFGRAIVRGKQETFTDDEQAAALEYARLVPIALRFQVAYLGFLYAALAIQQTVTIVQDPDDALLPALLLTVGCGVFVVVIPILFMQIRRARRFVETHSDEAHGDERVAAQA